MAVYFVRFRFFNETEDESGADAFAAGSGYQYENCANIPSVAPQGSDSVEYMPAPPAHENARHMKFTLTRNGNPIGAPTEFPVSVTSGSDYYVDNAVVRLQYDDTPGNENCLRIRCQLFVKQDGGYAQSEPAVDFYGGPSIP